MMVDGYRGYRDVLTYLEEGFAEVLTSTSESIVIRLYGTELEVLRSKRGRSETNWRHRKA